MFNWKKTLVDTGFPCGNNPCVDPVGKSLWKPCGGALWKSLWESLVESPVGNLVEDPKLPTTGLLEALWRDPVGNPVGNPVAGPCAHRAGALWKEPCWHRDPTQGFRAVKIPVSTLWENLFTAWNLVESPVCFFFSVGFSSVRNSIFINYICYFTNCI